MAGKFMNDMMEFQNGLTPYASIEGKLKNMAHCRGTY